MNITRTHIMLSVAGIGIVLSSVVFAALTASQNVSSGGIVKTLGVDVYGDKGCSQKVSFIEWGDVAPGATYNRTVYIRNAGTVAEILRMTTGNWTPNIASHYMALRWNCEAAVLNHDSSVKSILTLKVWPNITGIENFSFDIRFVGTET